MHPEGKELLLALYQPKDRRPIADWASENIDFSLAPNYDTPLHAPFDPEFAPYMLQVLDWLQDHGTREIWIRKCSRAGATEYVLAWLRWIVAENPMPTYYLTADQLTTERFMESRIKRGFACCPAANRYYRQARVTEHDIRFTHMDFRVSWPTAKGAFKQDGWSAIVADEFSTWKAFASEMLRKRAGTYRYHKIVGLSSPDPTRKGGDGDPVILEWEKTDQCRWMMPDPKTGNLFEWRFDGLKWPEDCKDAETGEWDLARVESESYYLTPDGTRIENSERATVNATGQWVSQAEDGSKGHHGIWIVGPMVPFIDGDFGVLASRFVSAKRRGNDALRAYFYENWADIGISAPDSAEAGDDEIRARELDYELNQNAFEIGLIEMPTQRQAGLCITFDVQKYHMWYVARYWNYTGEKAVSALHSWGNVANMDDARSLIDRLGAGFVGFDIGYDKAGEISDACSTLGYYALKGSDQMEGITYVKEMDSLEGRAPRASNRNAMPYTLISWNTDYFRSKLLAAIRGESVFDWHIPQRVGRQYIRQVCSTHKVNGIWERRKGYPDDHLFDCEVMQLVLARYDKLIQ